MTQSKRSGRACGVVSVAISVVSLVLAGVAFTRTGHSRPDDSYDRMVRETWECLKPMYDDFGIALPKEPPQTLKAALEPLMTVSGNLGADDSPEP